MHTIAIRNSKPGVGLTVGLTAGIFCGVSGIIDGVATCVAFNVGEGDISLVGPDDEGETASVGDGGTGVIDAGPGVGEMLIRGSGDISLPMGNLRPFGTTSISLTL